MRRPTRIVSLFSILGLFVVCAGAVSVTLTGLWGINANTASASLPAAHQRAVAPQEASAAPTPNARHAAIPMRHMPRVLPDDRTAERDPSPFAYAGARFVGDQAQSSALDIIGGKEAIPGAYPWQVALVFAGAEDALAGQLCGGTLIAPEWVLTAAHCVYGALPQQIDVVLGRHRLSSSDGERIHVAELLVHPQYWNDYDIALIRLERPSSQPIVSLDAPNDLELEEQRAPAKVIGWGVYEHWGSEASDPLLEVDVPLRPRSVCNAPNVWDGQVTENMICVGDEDAGETPCYGDSGGPLLVRNSSDTGWAQIGIVSWGPYGCVEPGFYAVFTRISTLRSWVDACLLDSESNECRGDGYVADASEPNNGPESATAIALNGPALHLGFHLPADNDWVRFSVQPGAMYLIETSGLGQRSDTVIWLRKDNAFTQLAMNDEFNYETHASQIVWTAPFSGTVYLQVHPYVNRLYGAETQYDLSIIELNQHIYLPLMLAECASGICPVAPADPSR